MPSMGKNTVMGTGRQGRKGGGKVEVLTANCCHAISVQTHAASVYTISSHGEKQGNGYMNTRRERAKENVEVKTANVCL